jgi:hypothetical protein
VTIGTQTSPSALPTNQFNVYDGDGSKEKASIGVFYNRRSSATRVAVPEKGQQKDYKWLLMLHQPVKEGEKLLCLEVAIFRVNDFGKGFQQLLYSSCIRHCVGGEAMVR